MCIKYCFKICDTCVITDYCEYDRSGLWLIQICLIIYRTVKLKPSRQSWQEACNLPCRRRQCVCTANRRPRQKGKGCRPSVTRAPSTRPVHCHASKACCLPDGGRRRRDPEGRPPFPALAKKEGGTARNLPLASLSPLAVRIDRGESNSKSVNRSESFLEQ